MNGPDLEVVWPLSKFHYLSPELVMSTALASSDPASSPPIVETPGRELAARALAAGPDCTQQRVSDLLGVSRRTIGRMADAEYVTALRDPQVLEAARACLAETARRSSTAEERDAAIAWLEEAARDEHQVERALASRRPAARRPAPRPARRPSRHGAPRNGAATSSCVTPPAAAPPDPRSNGANGAASLPQVDALRRQQQRILHRTLVIGYTLKDEMRGEPAAAIADLLADIDEAARTIGTLLHAGGNERPPRQ